MTATSASAQSCTRQWLPTEQLAGVNGPVLAVTSWDPDGAGPMTARVVVAGAFSRAAGRPAGNIAVFNPATTTWSTLGTGIGGSVYALATMPNGHIIAAGDFMTAGGVAVNRVARWNGSSWSALGTGMDAPVRALAVMANGTLVAGGEFFNAGGQMVRFIARWNGSSWASLGTGMDFPVLSLVALSNGQLVAGGILSNAGGVPASRVALWNGTSWSAMGSGLEGEVTALAASPNGQVLAGGLMYNQSGVAEGFVSRWNGTSWSSVGDAFNGRVLSIAVLPGGEPIASGQFTAAGGAGVNRIARWNGTSWSPLGTGADDAVESLTVLPAGELFAGGRFATIDGLSARHVARWNGASWSTTSKSMNDAVLAFAVTSGGDLIAGGDFTEAGGGRAPHVARRSGTSWLPMGAGMNDAVLALASLPEGAVVAGGDFTTADGSPAGHVARWNGSAWSAMGTGMNGAVRALAKLPNGDVIAGGDFTLAGGVAANHVARWNGSAWSAMGTGMNGVVHALAALPDGGLIAGGSFSTAGSVDAACVARWNGMSWSPLGTGINGTVHSLAALPGGGVVAGGMFGVAGGTIANNIARWDGSAWSPLGGGTNNWVASVAVLSDGRVIAGGFFTQAGGLNVNGVAGWDGSSWSSLGMMSTFAATAMAVLPVGDLVAGGLLADSQGIVNAHWARYSMDASPTVATSPSPQSPCPGQTVRLSASPGDGYAGVGFQWRRNGVNIVDGPRGASTTGGFVSGASGTLGSPTADAVVTLTISAAAASDSGAYTCVFTNACGSATTSAATLTIAPGPVITAPPVDARACQGRPAVLSVIATGASPLTYQWQKAGIDVPGAISATLRFESVTPADAAVYHCVLTNPCGSVTTSAAVLTVDAPPTLVSQPTAAAACPGGDATFSVVAAGAAPLSFQWRKDGVDIVGATASTLLLARVDPRDEGSFDCVIVNDCGAAISMAATLTVNTPAAIVTEPVSVAACEGSSARFTIDAIGTPAPLLQWRKNGEDIPNANATSYTIDSATLDDAGTYDCVVANECMRVVSEAATLTVSAAPVVVSQPVSIVVCLGRPATFSVVAAGEGALSYQWRRNGANIQGATSSTLSIAATSVADLATYECIVGNGCGSVASASATLSQAVRPVNDDISGGLPLTFGVAESGVTCAATIDSGAGQCDGQAVTAPGVWYRLSGTGTEVTVSLCGSSFNTRLSVYCSRAGSLTCVAGNDDACGQSSSVSFCAEDGGDYHLLVHGAGSATGSFVVVATSVGTPCTPGVRCLPVGACCTADGCELLTAPACVNVGGAYLGDGTSCTLESYGTRAASRDPFPVQIPDMSDGAPGQAVASVRVRGTGVLVSSLAVSVALTHLHAGDLVATLRKDTTTVTLFSRVGDQNALDDVYVFDDAASERFSVASTLASPVAGGIYSPDDSLSRFDGMSLDGTWILTVSDHSPEWTGQIVSFSIGAVDRTTACPSCPPCAADYNVDGGVDFGDVDAFFADWENSGGCADLNQDGGIDFGDLETFVQAWEAGGC